MPGRYRLERKASEVPLFALLTPDGDARIPCARDLNHNGALERIEQELARTIKQGLQVAPGIGMFALNVLFHPGYETRMPGETRTFSSIGCQTAPLAAMSASRPRRGIVYVLAEAEGYRAPVYLSAPHSEGRSRGTALERARVGATLGACCCR